MSALPSPHPRMRCLLESTAAHPRLSLGVPPEGLLAPEERVRFDGFQVAKRRRDWLLGRWTAKHLVRSYLAESGLPPPLSTILILPEYDGSPYASLMDSGTVARLPLSLSISHSENLSFCALTTLAGATVGADIEWIRPRPLSLPEQFFTREEFATVLAAPDSERDLLVTLIWSAKESFLKSVGTGLRTDTRKIRCLVPAGRPDGDSWWPLDTIRDTEMLSAPAAYHTWWRLGPGYVLTLGLLSRP